jgi:hypothetical protein
MRSHGHVIHQCSEVTLAWIERALGLAVVSFEAFEPMVSNWGSHVRLRVWVAGIPEPLKLHLKIASVTTFGRAEVDYYTRHFVGLVDAPLVRCHHADADATYYNLLLDDLAETHRDQKMIEPTASYGRALIEAAGKLHAYFWPQLPPDMSLVELSLSRARVGQEAMREAMNEGFTPAERATADRILARNPIALRSRLADPEGFTWIHGDLNPTNVLAPIHGDTSLYLIDHQPFVDSTLPSWLGAADLAYAIVLWWPVEIRRQNERLLIEHWHATLAAHGVKNYSLAKAWDDWRLCGLLNINVPTDWCSQPASASDMRWLWEVQLRRVLAFADDHL